MFEEIFEIDELAFNAGEESARILLVDHNAEQGEFIVNKLSRYFRVEVCDNLGMALLKALEKDYSLL